MIYPLRKLLISDLTPCTFPPFPCVLHVICVSAFLILLPQVMYGEAQAPNYEDFSVYVFLLPYVSPTSSLTYIQSPQHSIRTHSHLWKNFFLVKFKPISERTHHKLVGY